jgi:hypothetical protein
VIRWIVAKSCTTKRWLKPKQNNGINHQLVQDFATSHSRNM